ncbi:DNA mismatch repair endonuclease MutH [Aliikangiella sp. IMCC44653]
MIGQIAPPKSVTELLERTQAIAGKRIGEVASKLNINVPQTLLRQKGWQGQFIEVCLGANSGSLSQPDFVDLQIELKTLPIDFNGKVQESTYVSVLNLSNQTVQTWQDSAVYHKLKQVLWVPIAKSDEATVMDSVIATPFLWRPSAEQLNILQMDWENALEMVNLGKVDQLNARQGEILQVRPKAANSKALTKAYNRQGESIETLPRGFYLRSQFTQQILNENLKVN